jgi:hypothetical protein
LKEGTVRAVNGVDLVLSPARRGRKVVEHSSGKSFADAEEDLTAILAAK